MHRIVAAGGALASLVLASLAGCGQKGPLYLPDQARGVVTRPVATAPAEGQQSPNSPQTPDSPAQPANPAPEVTAPGEDKDKKHPTSPPPHP
jgi:predicted small lipoprotein YifL